MAESDKKSLVKEQRDQHRSRRSIVGVKHTADIKPDSLWTFITRKELSKQERETAGWWTATVCIGLLVGITEFVMTIILALANTWRYDYIQGIINVHGLLAAGFFAVFTSSVLVVCAALMTVFVSPMASGSGLPEMKGFLNANRIPGLFRLSTFVVRMVGVCLCLVAGLPLGREGPMVHIGGCIGHWVANQYHKLLGKQLARERHTFPAVEEEISKDIKRLFVTLGGAAGIAAAFKAPVGGVLYMFEELASFWSPETTFRAFVCTTVAAISLSAMLSRGNAVETDRVVIYFTSSSESAEWHFVDLLPTLLISVLCGVAASVFTKLFLLIMKWRRSSKLHKKYVWIKILDAAILGMMVTIWKFSIADIFKCKPTPDSSSVSAENFFQYSCNSNQYNDFASLALTGTEGSLKLLFVRGANATFLSGRSLSGLFFTVMVFGCGIAGLPIPMGLFMPNMLMGATLGRLCGQAAHALGFTYLADPGVFALIGAGAMLGAFTRMTITVAVLLVEATADLTILAPMMLGISVAKLVAQSLVHHLDHVLLGMKAIPYLETDTPDVLANKVASDIVVKVPTVFERSSIALLQKVLGDAPSCDAFPVVSSSGKLRGLVRREALNHALELANEGEVARMRRLYDDHVIQIPASPSAKLAREASTGIHFGYHSDAESQFDPVSDREDTDSVIGGGSPSSHSSNNGNAVERTPPKGLKFDPKRKVTSDTVPSHAEDGTLGVAVHFYMDSAPYAVVGELPLRRVYPLFRKLNLQHVVVIDGNARVNGMISRSDLLRVQHEAEEAQHGHTHGWLQGYLMFRKQRGHKRHSLSGASFGDTHAQAKPPGVKPIDSDSKKPVGPPSAASLQMMTRSPERYGRAAPASPGFTGIVDGHKVSPFSSPESRSTKRTSEPLSPLDPEVLKYENSFTYKQQKAADQRLTHIKTLFSGLLATQAKETLEEKVDSDNEQKK